MFSAVNHLMHNTCVWHNRSTLASVYGCFYKVMDEFSAECCTAFLDLKIVLPIFYVLNNSRTVYSTVFTVFYYIFFKLFLFLLIILIYSM